MYVEYGTACATSASGVYNLGGSVRGVHKSGVRISPLPGRNGPRSRGGRRSRSTGRDGGGSGRGPSRSRSRRRRPSTGSGTGFSPLPRPLPRKLRAHGSVQDERIRGGSADLQTRVPTSLPCATAVCCTTQLNMNSCVCCFWTKERPRFLNEPTTISLHPKA